MTRALAMIVRDSGEGITACLDSALPWIDKLIVIDTGSEDGTPERIQDWAKENGIELNLRSSPWVSFQHNRTELMLVARNQADWLLLLDDDMVLHLDAWPTELADSYLGRIGERGLDYKLPLIVSGRLPWVFAGVAHCYLDCPLPFAQAVVDGLWVEDHSQVTTEKIERDIELLAEQHVADPLDARTVFYLARSYDDLDAIPQAIHYYRMRAMMDGWPEETYFARYRLGLLLCEHVSYQLGAEILLQAWRDRPSRAEALRALAAVSESVADKIPYPDDLLFVNPGAYRQPAVKASEVTAVVVTRGNVDLEPVLENLPYDEIIIWDNSKRPDQKVYGRYLAAAEARNDLIFSVDDDVIFREHERLLFHYEPGKILANMDESWVSGAGYGNEVVLVGAGSLWDRNLASEAFQRYLSVHPMDEDFLLECDFIFGAMTPFKRVDLGYEIRPFADGPDRLYQQPGQTERKWAAIGRAKALVV